MAYALLTRLLLLINRDGRRHWNLQLSSSVKQWSLVPFRTFCLVKQQLRQMIREHKVQLSSRLDQASVDWWGRRQWIALKASAVSIASFPTNTLLSPSSPYHPVLLSERKPHKMWKHILFRSLWYWHSHFSNPNSNVNISFKFWIPFQLNLWVGAELIHLSRTTENFEVWERHCKQSEKFNPRDYDQTFLH